MKLKGSTFCNLCGGEIPAGEPTHEFETALLAKMGHCHDECLVKRNAILRQFEEMVMVCSDALNPGVQTHEKMQQIMVIAGKRGKILARAPKHEPKDEGVHPDLKVKSTKGLKVTYGKVKRGA